MYINLGISIRYHGTLMKVDHGYNDILECLRPYGLVSLFGSARVGKEFISNHDIDIGIVTELKSKKFLAERCIEVIEEFGILSLPLHFIIIGKFDSEYRYIEDRGVHHLIQFVPRKWRYLIWLKTSIKKWTQSLWKKSKNINKNCILKIALR
jgi:predicted nucleotidyltransferase